MTTPSTLQQIYEFAVTAHWLPLIALASLWVRKLASPQSAFPLPIPTTWLPTVSASGGLAYGLVSSIQSGEGVEQSIFDMIALAAGSGFADGLLTAIFAHASAPGWARWLVGVFDELGGSGGAPGGKVSASHAAATAFGVRPSAIEAVVAPPASAIPVVHTRRAKSWSLILDGAFLCVLLLIGSVAACGVFQSPPPGTIPSDVQADQACVVKELSNGVTDPFTIGKDCIIPEVATVVNIIETLLSSKQYQADHAAAIPGIKADLKVALKRLPPSDLPPVTPPVTP